MMFMRSSTRDGALTRRRVLKSALVGGASAVAGHVLFPSRAEALIDPEIAGYIEAQGGRLWYRLNGARHLGGPKAPLLCLHGGPGGHHRLLTPLAALADERAVILYDQLDSGHSDHPGDPKNWTTARFVSEIDAVRKALELEHVALLGHSMGGGWAAAYAVDRPAGLKALILSSPLISTSRWVADNNRYRAQLPANVKAILAKHENAGTTDHPEYQAATQRFYDRHLCLPPCPMGDLIADAPGLNTKLYEYMWGPTEFFANGTLVDFDLSQELKKITAPTLFMCGDVDEAAPATCRAFAAKVPDGRFTLIEGAAHATIVTRRKKYLDTVRGFLKDAKA